MKATLKILFYTVLSAASLLLLAVVGVIAFMRWEYHLPSDQQARQQFEDHRAEFVRFASLLRQDQRPRVIGRNGVDDAFEKDARAVPNTVNSCAALARRLPTSDQMVLSLTELFDVDGADFGHVV